MGAWQNNLLSNQEIMLQATDLTAIQLSHNIKKNCTSIIGFF